MNGCHCILSPMNPPFHPTRRFINPAGNACPKTGHRRPKTRKFRPQASRNVPKRVTFGSRFSPNAGKQGVRWVRSAGVGRVRTTLRIDWSWLPDGPQRTADPTGRSSGERPWRFFNEPGKNASLWRVRPGYRPKSRGTANMGGMPMPRKKAGPKTRLRQ